MGSGSPVSRITHYRGRSDAGAVDATPTWIAAEDTSFGVTVGTAFRVRIGVENTGTASDTINYWTSGTDTGCSRCGYPDFGPAGIPSVLNSADASSDADATNVTVQRLSNGTGSFAAGSAGYDENESLSTAVANGNFTEIEYGLVLTGGSATIGVGGGETWTIKCSGLTNAPLNVPTFTTPDTNGTKFQHGNQLGGAGSASATTSIDMTTAADVRANNLVVVAVSKDNTSTVDGDNSEVTGVTIGGAAMTKAVEFTNSQAAAPNGATVSIWWLQPVAQINSGSTITASFSSITSKAIQAREFIVAASNTVSVEATNSVATDGATQPAALDCTTTNIECLRVVAHAYEYVESQNTCPNSIRASNNKWSFWWTSGNIRRISSQSSSVTQMTSIVEATVSTGTSDSSRIGTLPDSSDWASAYVAFKATAIETVAFFGNPSTNLPPGYQSEVIGY